MNERKNNPHVSWSTRSKKNIAVIPDPVSSTGQALIRNPGINGLDSRLRGNDTLRKVQGDTLLRAKTGLLMLFLLLLVLWPVFSGPAFAACRNPNLVLNAPFFLKVANSGFVEIQWFGHSFFQITSSAGTKIITDPFGNMGFPMPDVWSHVVTVGRETGNHNNVYLPKGNPLILRGMKDWGGEWNEINITVKDVLIYDVPIHTRAPHELIRGTAFVFEMDGLCICHAGDVGEPFNEDQLNLLGHVDVLLIPIGGTYTMGPDNARKVVEQLKPKIVVPMHYYHYDNALPRFLDGPYRARFLETSKFTVSKGILPPVTEIYIPKIIWPGRNPDI